MTRKGPRAPDLERFFEGQDALSALLIRAGSTHNASTCEALFAEAAKAGQSPAAVFPTLFKAEPRFASPDDARRLYGNLFGLWDLVASGRSMPRSAPPAPEPRPPVERPAPMEGDRADARFVEAAWKYLADLPQKEAARLRDRYEETQTHLAEFVREVSPPREPAADTADAIAFEIWAIHDLAFGPAPRRASQKRLAELHRQPIAPTQEAIATYAFESLTEAQLDEEQPINEEEKTSIGLIVVTLLAALEELRKSAGN
jgi:hypothetical protein